MKASNTVCTRLSIIISHRKSITNDLKIKLTPTNRLYYYNISLLNINIIKT